jgi:hypothetical protein
VLFQEDIGGEINRRFGTVMDKSDHSEGNEKGGGGGLFFLGIRGNFLAQVQALV